MDLQLGTIIYHNSCVSGKARWWEVKFFLEATDLYLNVSRLVCAAYIRQRSFRAQDVRAARVPNYKLVLFNLNSSGRHVGRVGTAHPPRTVCEGDFQIFDRHGHMADMVPVRLTANAGFASAKMLSCECHDEDRRETNRNKIAE